ncbi:hypothetical protein EJV47_07040 [Hymenobacter gummosus]|uniref:Uncharacterized protein n=1 Tax=Hymenobacter gummosus TaxID=1776032 RepID=A0A3S0HAT3_9BACT|nr:hypothetical protein [Hymenobacter gummosus]RTQ51547.1 hypothetical protein EJV47_07040 [Hymenobacter gummosus]
MRATPAVAATRPPVAVTFGKLVEATDSVRGQPAVRLNGQLLRIEATARTDRQRPLPVPADYAETETDSAQAAADSVMVPQGFGFDAVYTIRLSDAGGRARFTTRLRKPDFGAAMGKEHVTICTAEAPEYLGYWPQANLLAFSVMFYLDGTDDGGAALLLLDAASGQPRRITQLHWFAGPEHRLDLTPDGRALLATADIIHADGRRVSLERPDRQLAAARLLNNQTVLAVYDTGNEASGGPRRKPGPNARLLDLNGRELGRFQLNGLAAEIGYQLRAAYLPQTRTHYLFDDVNRTLRLLPFEQPRQSQLLPWAKLTKFRAPRRPTEVDIQLHSGADKPTFYVDTLSGAVRYQLQK